MRQCINGDAVDNTAKLQGDLLQRNEVVTADLFQIATWYPVNGSSYPTRANYFLTGENQYGPLRYGSGGSAPTFEAAVISRNDLSWTDTLEVDTLELTWTPKAGLQYSFNLTLGNIPILQAFQNGIFDNASVFVWRAFMPCPIYNPANPVQPLNPDGTNWAPGNLQYYGAVPLFAGRVAEIDVGVQSARLTVPSYLELLNVMVPVNTIEPGYRSGYANQTNGVPLLDGLGGSAAFAITAGGYSNTGFLVADCTSDSGYIVPAGAAALGFIQIGGITRSVLNNGSGVYGGVLRNTFTMLQPFPTPSGNQGPPAGSTFEVMIPPPANTNYNPLDPALAVGFPYVPLENQGT